MKPALEASPHRDRRDRRGPQRRPEVEAEWFL